MLKKLIPFLSLFASFSTIICCALPALLVTVGLGASLASYLGSYPQLIWLSEHKSMVFSFAGFMLGLSAFIRWRWKDLSCPTDPELARACMRARRFSSGIFYTSLLLYALGAFFAFAAPLLLAD